ncbi:carbohydrate ABC transporter permease [Bacillus sp. SD088]|uniref:carbohydrate ABC transporter permease n=1 Tax=Bacillus sp. SD088 TaxID=2782012 RepID=UPI001A97C32E|nr:carbohydrate ABC transporter permease [Bacillus sp. SD088]MBO0994919.1 carbohydrate ABC transporter permease [Bacillus sp. SD088]
MKAKTKNIDNTDRFLTVKDKAILYFGFFLLFIFVLLIIGPLIYVLIASLNDPVTLASQGISLNITKWNLEGYTRVLGDDMIWRGFMNSTIYSIGFTAVSVTVTMLAAYPLSRKDFMGRRFFTVLFIITMFFTGGLMPTYLLIENLNLMNTPWAVILPNAINVWNIILARVYYQSVPVELREAALMDGATELQYFLKIMIPVCKPIIAVLILYQFVAQWNSYFDAMIYLDDQKLHPLQLVIRSILVQNTMQAGMLNDAESAADAAKLAELLKYSTIVISSLPLLIMYPFFAKYFDKGIMIGSVKG